MRRCWRLPSDRSWYSSLPYRLGSHPWHYYALIGLLAVAVSVTAQPPASAPYRAVPDNPQSAAPPVSGTAGSATSALETVLQLAGAARQSFQSIHDYTCLMIKQERIRGQLEPENVIEMKMRSQPFSVYLHWLGPNSLAGQEACFVAGRNNNMMRVHPTGLKGAFGFLSIPANDPRVMEHSRHTITEAGLGNLIDRLTQCWLMDQRYNKAQVNIAEYQYDKRRCIRAETIRPERTGGGCCYHRTVVYFDKDHHLPVRVELYDWPRSGGNPEGELLESYSYVNMRFNVNLSDGVFNH